MLLDPDQSADWRPVYRLLTSLVVPRPIAWVSTRGADGRNNLAPFSFFNVVCARPPVIVFCPMLGGRSAQPKDTLNNLREHPEFAVHLVPFSLAEQMNLTSGEYAEDVDEFEVAGLTPRPARRLAVDCVAEAPAVMECRLRQIIEVGEGSGSGALVLGEVVLFEVDDRLWRDGEIQRDLWQPIGRLDGSDYCRLTETFSIERPDPMALGLRPRGFESRGR